jgi:predicted DsbA family dithiol-disulfide isomerase
VLNSDKFGDEVRADIEEAQNIGVKGVPFFVFNRAYAISGAQPVEAFTQTLTKSFDDWKQVRS